MADIDTRPEQEYLYVRQHLCSDGCWSYAEDRGIYYAGREPGHQCCGIASYPISKKTAKRFYFRGGAGCCLWERESTFFVDRAIIEAQGGIYHNKIRKVLLLKRPEIGTRSQPESLSELRRQMADAHPDKGGTREAFEAARAVYLAAKARTG